MRFSNYMIFALQIVSYICFLSASATVSNFSVFRNFLVGVLIWTPNQVKFNSLYGFVPSSEGDRNLSLALKDFSLEARVQY